MGGTLRYIAAVKMPESLATVCLQYASAQASVALDAVGVVLLKLCAPSAMDRWITRAVKACNGKTYMDT